MISIPIVVNNERFEWQLSLFWHNHKKIYGSEAYNKAKAVVIKRNYPDEVKQENFVWDIDVPYEMCEGCFDFSEGLEVDEFYLPFNTQIGLYQILHKFDDEEVLEVLDPDMFHMRPHPNLDVLDDHIYVAHVYEDWHLKSLSDNQYVIKDFFLNGGSYYNGGFLPIIGKAKTFKKILNDWIFSTKHIADSHESHYIRWWANMFGLQVGCERNKIKMVGLDCCYVPMLHTDVADSHYVCHFSCDLKFNKRKFPEINVSDFEDNLFYHLAEDWMKNFHIFSK